MRSTKELSAIIRRAMKEKNLDQQGMAKLLGVGDLMIGKILCGDVVPSRHLEKQMVETLELPEATVHQVSARREARSKAKEDQEARRRKAA